MNTKPKCKEITKKGVRCKITAGQDGYCSFHSPARTEAQQEARKKGGATPPTKILTLDGNIKLDTVAKVDELIDKVIDELMKTTPTRGGAFNLKKGRTIGYLAGIKLRAFEAGTIEERLTALEEQVRIKRG
jgi:hypothetical protein